MKGFFWKCLSNTLQLMKTFRKKARGSLILTRSVAFMEVTQTPCVASPTVR